MASTKSNFNKLKNVKKEKHQKEKSKTKRDSLDFDASIDPFMKEAKNNDLRNFWKYSRKNPFSIQKCQKFEAPKCFKKRVTPKFSSVSSGWFSFSKLFI